VVNYPFVLQVFEYPKLQRKVNSSRQQSEYLPTGLSAPHKSLDSLLYQDIAVVSCVSTIDGQHRPWGSLKVRLLA